MGDAGSAGLFKVTDGGLSGTHPETGGGPPEAPVAPSLTAEFNTFRFALIPKACWKMEDVRFAFDSSLLLPGVKDEMAHLRELVEKHSEPGADGGAKQRPPLTVFGHADPTGRDAYNKTLSGRRATAVYAALTRRTALWEKLYTPPEGGDDWAKGRAVPVMLESLGFSGGETPAEDVKAFQRKNELKDDGIAGPKTRAKLFRAYMDFLCGPEFVLDPKTDFLARGEDPDGKGDYQGCGEFNPLLVFSQQEARDFEKAENKPERDRQNGPNRRVMVFLFRPGRRANPERWPCPRANEGFEGCKQRFFSDAETRRANGPARREFKDTKDTFACRFYHRFAVDSPCEVPVPPPPPKCLAYLSVSVFFHRQPIEGLTVEFFQPDGGGAVGAKVKTDAKGRAFLPDPVPAGRYACRVQYQPDAAVTTVPNAKKPFPLVLPIGRPYYDFRHEDDYEFEA